MDYRDRELPAQGAFVIRDVESLSLSASSGGERRKRITLMSNAGDSRVFEANGKNGREAKKKWANCPGFDRSSYEARFLSIM